MITPFPPIRLSYETRLRKLNRQQPKATVANVPTDRLVDLVVLATKATGATCRLKGWEEVLYVDLAGLSNELQQRLERAWQP